MARRPKHSVPPEKRNKIATALHDAVQFCSLASHDDGAPNETHIVIRDKWAQCFDGTVAASAPIIEDIEATPRTKLMLAALAKCGQSLNITQLENNRLSVKSNSFRAIVPCLDPTLLAMVPPDAPRGQISNEFLNALEIAVSLIETNGMRPTDISVCTLSGSVIATDGAMMLEAWHGIDMPQGLMIPKATIVALSKTKKQLAQFGFSDRTITFFFTDDTWMRSQLIQGEYPVTGAQRLLNEQSNQQPILAGFREALTALAPFSENGYVTFDEGLLCAHTTSETGATYNVTGLPRLECRYAIEYLQLMLKYATTVDMQSSNKDCMMFYGDKVRGIIMGARRR